MPETILLVDDDPHFLAMLRRPLDGAGYSVVEAMDGDTALTTIDRLHEQLSLVVIDLALPAVSGFEILGAITRRNAPVKTIVITGVLKDLYLEIARSMGADMAIRKPPGGRAFKDSEWLGTVRAVLGGDDTAGSPN